MRRFVIGAAVTLMLGLGTGLLAQGISSPEEYAKVMKSNAQAFGAVNKAVKSAAFADAKGQVATLRTNYMMLQTFWNARKTATDAQGFVKDGLAGIDALDKALSAATVDPAAAQAAATQIQGTCGGCHKAQREGDAQSGWKFKPGVF
jgi:hypothetical protein